MMEVKKKFFFGQSWDPWDLLKKKTKALAGVHSFTGCNEKKWFELAITGGLGLTVMSWTGRYYNAKRIVAKESRSGNDSKPGKKLLALQLRKGHRRPRQHHRPQQRRLHLKPRPSELVYLQPSPNYCEADAAAGSPGVAGRHCNRSSAGEKWRFCSFFFLCVCVCVCVCVTELLDLKFGMESQSQSYGSNLAPTNAIVIIVSRPNVYSSTRNPGIATIERKETWWFSSIFLVKPSLRS